MSRLIPERPSGHPWSVGSRVKPPTPTRPPSKPPRRSPNEAAGEAAKTIAKTAETEHGDLRGRQDRASTSSFSIGPVWSAREDWEADENLWVASTDVDSEPADGLPRMTIECVK